MNSEEKQSLIKSVNEASPDRLRQFIINQAQYDPSFSKTLPRNLVSWIQMLNLLKQKAHPKYDSP